MADFSKLKIGQILYNVKDAIARSGLLLKQDIIDTNNKLASDLVDDTNQTNKFVRAEDITNWNNKQNEIDSSNKLDSDLVDDTNQTNKFVRAEDITNWNNKQNEIDSSHKLDSDLVDDTNQTNKFVTSSDITNWNNKQNEIDSSHKLDSDLVDDTNQTNKFVNASDITTWNGKQDALVSGTNIKTVNNESILGSGNINISSGGGNVQISTLWTSTATDPYSVDFTPQTINLSSSDYDYLEIFYHGEGPNVCDSCKILKGDSAYFMGYSVPTANGYAPFMSCREVTYVDDTHYSVKDARRKRSNQTGYSENYNMMLQPLKIIGYKIIT